MVRDLGKPNHQKIQIAKQSSKTMQRAVQIIKKLKTRRKGWVSEWESEREIIFGTVNREWIEWGLSW